MKTTPFAWLAALAAVAACSGPVPMRNTLLVHADRPATTCGGDPIALGESRGEKGNFLYAGSTSFPTVAEDEAYGDLRFAECDGRTSPLNVGLHLRPGDVLHVASWWAGPGSAAQGERMPLPPPLAAPMRLPIRKIAPGGRLTDEETRFLGTVLSVQRGEQMGGSAVKPENARAAFIRNRVALWNTLVDSLRLKRVPVTVAGLQPTPLTLVLTLDRHAFCRTAVQEVAKAETTGGADAGILAKTLFPDDNGSCPERHGATEILGASPTYAGGLGAVAPQSAQNRPEFYGDAAAMAALFTFAGAERNGLSVRTPAYPERLWTLQEWEASGICRDADGHPRRITGVRPRAVPWMMSVQEEPGAHATRTVFTQGTVRRDLVRWLSGTFPRADLAALTIEDVSGIRWSGADLPADGSAGPDVCDLP